MPRGSHTQRVASAGWRETRVARIGFGIMAVIVAVYGFSLLGWPWTSDFALFTYGVAFGVLGLGWVLTESQRPLWIELSDTGLGIGYLFRTVVIPWYRARVSAATRSFGSGAIRDDAAAGLARREHAVTKEQLKRISRFRPELVKPSH